MNEAPPMPIQFAATVVIVRDADPQYEIFMLRRTSSAVFAGGMYVFPGGMLDAADAADDHADVITPPSLSSGRPNSGSRPRLATILDSRYPGDLRRGRLPARLR